MQKEQQMQTKPSQLTEIVSRPTGIKMALLLFWEFIKLGAFTCLLYTSPSPRD